MAQKLDLLQENLSHLDENIHQAESAQKIMLSDAEKIYLVKFDEIIRCESNGNYTSFFLTKDRKITVSQSIKVFEELLPSPLFYRIHRSHLLNLDFFDFYDKREGGTVHLKDGSTLPVAVRRKDKLLEILKHR